MWIVNPSSPNRTMLSQISDGVCRVKKGGEEKSREKESFKKISA